MLIILYNRRIFSNFQDRYVSFTWESWFRHYKLTKGKALRKHSLHGKTAASVCSSVVIKDATPMKASVLGLFNKTKSLFWNIYLKTNELPVWHYRLIDWLIGYFLINLANNNNRHLTKIGQHNKEAMHSKIPSSF